MDIFDNILSQLDLTKPVVKPTEQPAATPPPNRRDLGTPPPGKPAQTPPGGMPLVDVYSKLEKLSAARPEHLDWKVSIADLLNLLGMDYSYAARKQLATELGCPTEKMADSYQMNMWLHKTVLQKIAESGGNIPRDLLS